MKCLLEGTLLSFSLLVAVAHGKENVHFIDSKFFNIPLGGCGNCVFPFIYGDRIHDRCTSFDGDSPWCSTKVDADGVHVSGQGNWEYCSDPSCPGLAANPAEAITPHPLNVESPCCKYLSII